jgi:DNA-binding transcriptional ArsR family regulator
MSAAARRSAAREARAQASVFSALGDATRLQLVSRLSGRRRLSITRLTAGTGMTRQGVTKHLRVLAQAGVVRGVRRGRERVWELEPQRIEAARRFLDAISAQWDESLARLKALVEG